MNKQYTDKNIIVHTGLDAENLLNIKNDSIYIENGSIIKVDNDRWIEAQHYERKTWMEHCLWASDDRNYEHYNNFESYYTIKEYQSSFKIKSLIELGCGPFTNLRTIIDHLEDLEEVHLLDPLLDSYLTHPNCYYKNRSLYNKKTESFIPVTTHSIPIEKFDIENNKFDLVLINNVLEHCYDIESIFSKIYNMLNIGGLFVFGDCYFIKRDIEELSRLLYDSGHPLRLSKEYMEDYLSKYDVLFNKDIYTPVAGLHDDYGRHEKYFIGIKK